MADAAGSRGLQDQHTTIPPTPEAGGPLSSPLQGTGSSNSISQPAAEAPAAASEPEIEIDSEVNDSYTMGDIDEQWFTSSALLPESVRQYPMEFGRRYHAFNSGSYVMPNDEAELDRLDVFHVMFTKLSGNKLFTAPIHDPQRVLDVGTGTGIWSMQMGDAFPQAEVLGNDLSPVQPTWVPPNVRFEVDDVEQPWTYNNPFDFIFIRYMAASIVNWPRLVSQAYNHCAPGGWIELQDFDTSYRSDDGSLKEDNVILKWRQIMIDAAEGHDRDPGPGDKFEGWVKDAGFVNVEHRIHKLPIGPWSKNKQLKELGYLNLMQFLDGLEGFTLRLLTQVLGWNYTEVQVFLAAVRKALNDQTTHIYLTVHIVIGQKPQTERNPGLC